MVKLDYFLEWKFQKNLIYSYVSVFEICKKKYHITLGYFRGDGILKAVQRPVSNSVDCVAGRICCALVHVGVNIGCCASG